MRVTSSLKTGAGSASKQDVSRFIAEQGQYRAGKQGGDERGNKSYAHKKQVKFQMRNNRHQIIEIKT
jgi:hypothetical protein